DESSIHLGIDEALPKSDERAFAEGCLISVQTVQHELPPPIHEGRLDHFVIRHACVGLQNDRQGQLCGSDGWMPPLARSVEIRQFLLERFIEQFVPMVAQKHKEFRASYPCHNLLFLCRKFDFRLPKRWLHRCSPQISCRLLLPQLRL